MEKKALGKGLQALLPERKTLSWTVGQEIQEIPIERIIPNRYQPRKTFEDSDLQELSESLKESGMLQPVIVRRIGDGSFELIAGERRWRAAKLAGLTAIPALVRVSSDEKSLVMALVENIQRQNLNPMEEARAYSRLITEFELTQDKIAGAVGKDRSSVANIIRLASLPFEIQSLLESNQLTLGHAKILAGLSTSEQQLQVAKQIVESQLSVRQTEQKVSLLKKNGGNRPIVTRSRSSNSHLEEQLRKRLETKVKITKGHRGGKIVIQFFSENDLDRIAGLVLE